MCREHKISSATFYKWRSKFGGMDASMVSRMKELEEENRRLKGMCADSQLSGELLKEAFARIWRGHLSVVHIKRGLRAAVIPRTLAPTRSAPKIPWSNHFSIDP